MSGARTVRAWHFLPADRRCRYDGRAVVAGEWLAASGELALCQNGMHASRRALDALQYAPGPIVCRVELRGDVIEGTDKLVARERRVVWVGNATPQLRKFARLCALDVVHLWDCPPIVLRYLKTGDEQIRGAARDAARDAAWGAAWGAARVSAWDAAWGAARDRQSRRLTRMLGHEVERDRAGAP